MAIIRVGTILNAPADRVFEEARKPRLLQFVAGGDFGGRLAFRPIDPLAFPETWEEREYRVMMLWRGFLPIGEQIIGMELPTPENGRYFVRDNGRSATISRWDHLITIEPTGDGRAAYEDRLDLDAGRLTPVIAAWAKGFYEHRQRRWARLVDAGFDYGA
ncbi:MAG: hypothetical protein GC152_16310 [Alphaproteobacteria bacterium]|nr:hypothetical protein [Alphaproteobacteria bacterium]